MKTVPSDSKSMRTNFWDAEGFTVIIFGTREMLLVTCRHMWSIIVHVMTDVQGRKGSSCNTSLYCIFAWRGFS